MNRIGMSILVVSALLVVGCQAKEKAATENQEAQAQPTQPVQQRVTPTIEKRQPSPEQIQKNLTEAMNKAGLTVKPIPKDRRWWDAATPCSDGASLRGGAPPEGSEIWCALPDGRKHGRATRFAKLGHITTEGEHVQGQKHGTFSIYYRTGKTKMQVIFANGKENGPMTGWHPNGQKAIVGTYKDGKGFGAWTKWDTSGTKIGEGTY